MGIAWLACHNPEIDWRMGEVQIMRCPEECGKKWRMGRQTKPRWQKQEEKEEWREKEKKEDFKRLTTEKEMVIVRIMEEKEEERDEEEDLIELRTVEEMVSRWFHRYLKVFEKKELKRMLIRKT